MSAVEIELAQSVHARLRDIAEARGETVTQMMTAAAYRLARADFGSDEVGVLWGMKFTDKQIASELGWTNQRVSNRRRALGLPANKPKGRAIR